MKDAEIKEKARKLGIKNIGKYSKKELIKAIQVKEGSFACFGTAIGSCDQIACCWRIDCLK